jgi:hypothetical protein
VYPLCWAACITPSHDALVLASGVLLAEAAVAQHAFRLTDSCVMPHPPPSMMHNPACSVELLKIVIFQPPTAVTKY